MRIATAVLALALLLGAGACGGGEAVGPVAATPATPATATTTTAKPARRVPPLAAAKDRSCTGRQITAGAQREGDCMLGGTRLVAVNGRSLLRLWSLGASIQGIAASDELAGRGGRAVTPQNGAFLVITLKVRNRDTVARRFEWPQVVLGIGDTNYEQSRSVVERAVPGALAYAARGPIPAGAVREGQLVFDLPVAEVNLATSQGRLFVANFGASPLAELASHRGEMGFIRLYQ